MSVYWHIIVLYLWLLHNLRMVVIPKNFVEIKFFISLCCWWIFILFVWSSQCFYLNKYYQSPRKNFFFRYYLSSAGCLYVSMYVSAVVATPFNLELWNYGTTFLMGLPKKVFLKFLKNCFFAELSPFFYISLRFLCNFEEQLRKNKWR